MEFDYVVQRKEKGKVCFGSGLERKTLEADTRGLVSKHARENMKEMNPIIGPGKYDILNTALSQVMKKPTSKLGTVLGGRTAPRKPAFTVGAFTPGPGSYNIESIFSSELRAPCAPFNSSAERGQLKVANVPGVGLYNVAPYKRQTVPFAHSFGGKKQLLPAVKTKCGPYNFDTCERCQKYPEGDYWYLDTVEAEKTTRFLKQKQSKSEGIFLCRDCYYLEKKEHSIFCKALMKNFKKIRDCSKIHFHDGCEGKLFVVSPKEIDKMRERESYLGLYFA